MKIGKFLKNITGISAFQNRNEAKKIKESSEEKFEFYKECLEKSRLHLNIEVEKFGRKRCYLLKETVGTFLSYISILNINFKKKEYEIPEGLSLSELNVKEMESINMNATQIIATTAGSGVLASAALTGVPTAVTWGVTQFAAASTGTAISSLSGAAASNAVLAWLGGGSLASGGGGMVFGAAVLSGVTWGVTGGLALLSAGFIASKHFEKKLTEAKHYEAEIDKACAQADLACEFMNQIEQRICELDEITVQLCARAKKALNLLYPLLTDFSIVHPYQMHIFQENALLIKSISEMSKAEILDKNGNLSESGQNMIVKSKKILNTQL